MVKPSVEDLSMFVLDKSVTPGLCPGFTRASDWPLGDAASLHARSGVAVAASVGELAARGASARDGDQRGTRMSSALFGLPSGPAELTTSSESSH